MKELFAALLICFLVSEFSTKGQEVKKMVLVEQFSNTYCPPCIFKNPEFVENILENYEDTDLFHITYHPSTPIPNDIYFQANEEENLQRVAYYSIPGTPSVYLNGSYIEPGEFILTEEDLEATLGQTSPLKIEVSETANDDLRTVSVAIQTVGEPPTGFHQLRVMAIEKYIAAPPPFEGMEAEHYNTFRKKVNGEDGSVYVAPPTGVSTTYTFTYEIDPEWDPAQMYVIAFIQNDDTREVINASSSWSEEVVGVEELELSDNIVVYPNPFSDVVRLSGHFEGEVKVRLHSIIGQQLIELSYNSSQEEFYLDLKDLQAGNYFLVIEDKNKRWVKKLVKMQ